MPVFASEINANLPAFSGNRARFAPNAVNSCAKLRLTLSRHIGRANARQAARSAIPVSR
jgi:hypothetical protein